MTPFSILSQYRFDDWGRRPEPPKSNAEIGCIMSLVIFLIVFSFAIGFLFGGVS